MAKFIFIYKGPTTEMNDMTAEQSKDELELWNNWFEKIDNAMIDKGQPMGNGFTIVDDGSAGDLCPLNGYTIVEAANLEAAKSLTIGHPFLRDHEGRFAIDIFELYPLPK